MKRILFSLITFCSVACFGQYPVTGINISMPANPDANTANWGQGASPFSISAQTKPDSNHQVNPFVIESKILVIIKKGGGKVCGTYTNANAPASNFNAAFKVWNGRNGVSLLGQDCVLPAGEYELCVQFFGYRNGALAAFSDEKCKSFTIAGTDNISYQPPQNISPADGAVIKEVDARKPITFRWTPVVPKPQNPVFYKLKVWQLLQGQAPSQAMQTTEPIIQEEVKDQTQFIYRKGWDGTIKGGHAWRVEATDVQGKVLGVSEATIFSLKTNDDGPVQKTSLENLSPANGKVFTKAEIMQSMVFRWTPVIPKPKEDITYRLRVWALKNGQSPSDAIKNNVPGLTTETATLSSGSNACDTMIKPCKCFPGCENSPRYIWNVQALQDGKIIAESDAFTFLVSSAGCGTNNANVSLTCGKIINGLQTYNGVIQFSNIIPASGGQQCTTVMNAITSATGTITSLATLPVTIPVGGTSSAVNFIYTPTLAGAATASFSYQGTWNDGSNNTSNFTTANVQLPNCKKPSDCDCKSVQCTKKLWYKEVSTGIIKEFTCTNQKAIILNCDKNYHFFADTKCSPDTNCKMIIKGEFRNAAGALVIQQTPFNSGSSAFNIISGTPGNYTFIIKFYINDVECSQCTIPIVVSCNPPVDCCKGGSWGEKLRINDNGSSSKLDACGSDLGIAPCGLSGKLKVTYNCNPACNTTAQIIYQYYNAITNAPVGASVTVASGTTATITNPSVSGSYYLSIAAKCGDKICEECKLYFKLNCPKADCCQNATQKDPSVYDASGTNLATFSCTQPKTYYITPKNKNCDKELIIKASANCGSAANCPSKIIYTLLNTGTSAIITGTGVLTIPATLANGVYTLTVDYYCGNTICKTCKFEIIKDCVPVVDNCCKNSSWGEKIHYTSGGVTGGPVPKTLPASGGNLGVVPCGSIKQIKICYDCAQGCGTTQIKYDVYLAYSLVLVNSTTVASCSVASITMPVTQGNYQIRIAAICNGKECNAMDYFINTECKPVDCCKGGAWTNKSLDWDINIKVLQVGETEQTNETAQKATPQNTKKQKTAATPKIKPGDVSSGQVNPLSGSLKVAKCGDTLKINEGNEFTLNAAYTCNTALANCKGKVIAKVKDPNGITYGTWPLPHLFKFAPAGMYTVTYYAYCGETVCDSCTFYVNAAKDCCKESKWIKAEYQITNKKPNGDWDKSDQTYYPLPLTITSPIPVLKADVAIDLEKLEYSCAQGCTAGFILKRKNITTGVEETPEIITAGGTPSVYAKPYPQLITIVPTCGGVSCGNPIIFKVECKHNNCLPKDCCLGSKWLIAEYQIVNKKADGSFDWGNEAFYPLPTVSASDIPTYKADLAINLEHLTYQCATGCTPGYIIKRKNLITGTEEPAETLSPGQQSTSIYAKDYPQLITIIPTCSGQPCDNIIVFKVECKHKNCVVPCTAADTLNFSTGQNGMGGQIGIGLPDPYWQGSTTDAGLSGDYITWNKIPGSSILVPTNGGRSADGQFTSKRCFYVCKGTDVSFAGNFRDDNIVKSFVLRNSATSAIVWSLGGTQFPANDPQCYSDNPFSGSVFLPKGQYCFEFTYSTSDLYVGFALAGKLITSNPVLANTAEECCTSANQPDTSCGTWGPVRWNAIGEAANAHLMINDTIYQPCGSGVYFSHSFACNDPACTASINVHFDVGAPGCCDAISNTGYASNINGYITLTATCCGRVCSTKKFFIKILPCAALKESPEKVDNIVIGTDNKEIIIEPNGFEWTLPEVVNKLGYKSISFANGNYIIEKNVNNPYGKVVLDVASADKLNGSSSPRSLKIVHDCHFAGIKNCKGPGLSCLVLFPETMNSRVSFTPIIKNGSLVKIEVEFLSERQIKGGKDNLAKENIAGLISNCYEVSTPKEIKSKFNINSLSQEDIAVINFSVHNKKGQKADAICLLSKNDNKIIYTGIPKRLFVKPPTEPQLLTLGGAIWAICKQQMLNGQLGNSWDEAWTNLKNCLVFAHAVDAVN